MSRMDCVVYITPSQAVIDHRCLNANLKSLPSRFFSTSLETAMQEMYFVAFLMVYVAMHCDAVSGSSCF